MKAMQERFASQLDLSRADASVRTRQDLVAMARRLAKAESQITTLKMRTESAESDRDALQRALQDSERKRRDLAQDVLGNSGRYSKGQSATVALEEMQAKLASAQAMIAKYRASSARLA